MVTAEKKSPAGNRKAVTTAVIFAVVVACAIFLILFGEGRREFVPRLPKVEVTLYFSSPDGKGLSMEKRWVETNSTSDRTTAGKVEALVGLLIKGSQSGLGVVMPEGTRLLSVTIEGKLATVDLSREFVDNHWGGSSAELQSVYAIVDTVIHNNENVSAVKLLVEGESLETLKGHVPIDRPISFDAGVIETN